MAKVNANAVGGGAAGGSEEEAIAIDVHAAVQRNDEVVIKNYVLRGGNLEARDKDALTPLHVAAAGGFTNVVEYLTKEGARYVDVTGPCAVAVLDFRGGDRGKG